VTTVTVALYGGLGNQMFQYAMGRALSLRYQANLRLDLYGFEFDKRYRRDFDLAHFNLPQGLETLRGPLAFRAARFLRRLAGSAPIVGRLVSPLFC
jgi:hypothetical protein